MNWPGGKRPVADERRVPIRTDADIVIARQTGRALATEVGFSGSDLTVIATAISEVTRNIVRYAGSGEIVVSIITKGSRTGLQVVARDKGPGIPDLALAMQDGYSTGNSLGLGLPGSRRLMDEFDITTAVAVGTTVTLRKWMR